MLGDGPEWDLLSSSRGEGVDTIRGPIEPAVDVSVQDVPGMWVSDRGGDLRSLSWTIGLEERIRSAQKFTEKFTSSFGSPR